MTNQDILNIAMKQSAIDCSCNAEDFLSTENKVVYSKEHPSARKYLVLPFYCDLISYGNNIVASVDAEIETAVSDYISKYRLETCFETPHIYMLNDELLKHGMKICFMAEYFLPDVDVIKPMTCQYELKILHPKDFADLYKPQWGNAILERRKHLDRLAVGAYDGDKLVGLAGCSADCDEMWQIGVDVLPQYRRKGIAASITSHLAIEILKLGKVPFYCCAWSNMGSARNAVKSGFRPAWVEMTAKSVGFVDDLNK